MFMSSDRGQSPSGSLARCFPSRGGQLGDLIVKVLGLAQVDWRDRQGALCSITRSVRPSDLFSRVHDRQLAL